MQVRFLCLITMGGVLMSQTLDPNAEDEMGHLGY